MLRGARRTAATHRSEHVPNIYTFYVTYIEGYTGLYTNLALSLLPCRRALRSLETGGRAESATITRPPIIRPPEVRSGDFPFALPGWAPELGRIGKGTNRSQRSVPVPPTPGDLSSPEHGPQTPLALPTPHHFGKCCGTGAGARSEWFTQASACSSRPPSPLQKGLSSATCHFQGPLDPHPQGI